MKKAKPILSEEILRIRSLYKRLKKARAVLTWDEFADAINKDRTYISRVMNGHEPLTSSIREAIKTKFGTTENVPREKEGKSVGMDQPLAIDRIPTLGEYIDFLKKVADAGLGRLADIETNLGEIRVNQNLASGIALELLQRDVGREVKGNEEKKKETLENIAQKIGPNFDLVAVMGIKDGAGRKDIRKP